jgi:hypothetical protein
MRRAVLMTRQAISPRFAIRIFLNMLSDRLGFGRVSSPPVVQQNLSEATVLVLLIVLKSLGLIEQEAAATCA